jgi:hypothetical protein
MLTTAIQKIRKALKPTLTLSTLIAIALESIVQKAVLVFTEVLKVTTIRTKQELDHTIAKGQKAVTTCNTLYVKLEELKAGVNSDLKEVLKAKIQAIG